MSEDVSVDIAKSRLDVCINNIIRDSGCSEWKLFVSGQSNFRKEIDPSYKANRTGDDPKHREALRQHLIEEWDAVECNGYEADDHCGISQTLYNTLRLQFINNEEYKTISLGNGGCMKVSPLDYEWINKYKWSVTESGYAYRGYQDGSIYKRVYLHKEMLSPGYGYYGDHINGDKLDNRRTNLRIVNNQQNSWNAGKRTGNYKGISWDASRNKWQVGINIDGKRHAIGRFTSEEEAARVYDDTAISVYGQYARLNFCPLEPIICGIDKDLLQVPGLHYSWPIIRSGKVVREGIFREISKEEGMRRFFTQALTGDVSDNIKGIHGIGPKKAEKLLADCKTEAEMYNVCKSQYIQFELDNSEEAVRDEGRYRYLEEQGIQRFHRNCDLLWVWRELGITYSIRKEIYGIV